MGGYPGMEVYGGPIRGLRSSLIEWSKVEGLILSK